MMRVFGHTTTQDHRTASYDHVPQSCDVQSRAPSQGDIGYHRKLGLVTSDVRCHAIVVRRRTMVVLCRTITIATHFTSGTDVGF